MYNTEKYVGACLTSILSQTFHNYEVIVVDDCSTDNSCAVVESFIPKFGGRLKVIRSEVNRGPAVPTNKGIGLSHGKYIYLMDSDDLIVNNAFEILINFAESHATDLVNMDFGFKFIKNTEKPFPTQEDVVISGWHQPPFVQQPTLESEDIAERVHKICSVKIGWIGWQKFVRRDFLFENDIVIPELRTSQDVSWMIQVFLLAKKVLTIPQPLYIYRSNPTSNTNTPRSIDQHLNFFLEAGIKGLNFIDNFLSRQKFFLDNPKYRWEILNFFERIHFGFVQNRFSATEPYKSYDILRDNFKEIFGNIGNLIAYQCVSNNVLNVALAQMSHRIMQLENKLKELQPK